MNGPDLRMLAERASVLEDRSLDRLVDVHQRVAAERRRRRVAVVVTAVAAVILVLAASIALVSVDPTKRTPDPAPPPEPRADAYRPAEGTCWAVPPESAVDPEYVHDDSAQVPCSQEHTTETVLVLNLSEPTLDAADEATDVCADYVLNYLGIDAENWIKWGWVAFLPTEEQIAEGASWIRCDAVFPATLDWKRAQRVEGSARGVATDPPPDLWACLDQPWTTAGQPFVPCDRPHTYEQTGRLALLQGLTQYPTASERTAAEAQCDEGIPARLSGFAVEAIWDKRAEFSPGVAVAGVCMVHDPDGGPLPARRP